MNKFDKKNNHTGHTGWNLNVDRVHSYAYMYNVFTNEECEKIIKIANDKGLIEGETKIKKNNVRLSQICWLSSSDDLIWAYEKITSTVINLNEQYFKFHIFGFNEALQFTNYKAPGGKYGKHIDKLFNSAVRKLSLSIQLTNPTKYEGGELILYESDSHGEIMKKEQGTLILFPSYLMHEVKPVTKGERNSLVGWVTGNQLK